MAIETGSGRRFLFLLCSAREQGNSEWLARRAAERLPEDVSQRWIRLAEAGLPAFEDIRHSGDAVYSKPDGKAGELLEATLEATDLVFVVPLYWYSVPASAKLYLDHWSGWMRLAGLEFKARMAGKTVWAISAYSDHNPQVAEPMFGTLRECAKYMHMHWGGQVLGNGSKPGDVERDARATRLAEGLFAV